MTETLTTDQLRRKIAERLGWRAMEHIHAMPWKILNPEGELVGVGRTEDDAWLSAFRFNHNTQGDWLTDLNAAIQDLPMPIGATLTKMVDGWRASPERSGSTAVTCPNPAEAWCKAWIAWKAQSGD